MSNKLISRFFHIFLSLLFFLLFLFIFSNNVKAVDVSFQYQGQDYTLSFTHDNYNSFTDLTYLVYSRKSDFRSFGFVVLKDAKTYVDNGYIIKVDLNAPMQYSHYSFVAYKENSDGTFAFERLKFYYFRYISNTQKWGQWGGLMSGTDALTPSNSDFIYLESDLYDIDNNLLFSKSGKLNPYISNTDENLSSVSFDKLLIFQGGFNINDTIKFVIRHKEIISTSVGPYERLSVLYSTDLNSSSSYFNSYTMDYIDFDYWYEIPKSDLIEFKKGDTYIFSLEYTQNGENVYIDREIKVGANTQDDRVLAGLGSISSQITEGNQKLLEEERKTQEKIENQTNAIKEQTQVSKNIFEKIGDLVSFINPFSENFFVYKLIELLINALKSLFIPGDDFFSNYFNELMDFFSDRFGFLAYPFELAYSILSRFLNLNNMNPRFYNSRHY